MEDEAFINGFCKNQNQGRMVSVEFESENGKITFTGADCAYGKCQYQASCQIAEKIRREFGGRD